MTVILGLNGVPFSGHDPAAAIIVDNRILAMVEEERMIRKKRAMNFHPSRSLLEVMEIAELSPLQVDRIACPWIPRAMGVSEAESRDKFKYWLEMEGFRTVDEIDIQFVEHHTAHAWSGFSFIENHLRNKRIAALVLDGSGESTGGAAYLYFNDSLQPIWQLAQESSLGIYYEALTQYLGFSWGEEGKTMGLSAYGREMDLQPPAWPDVRLAPGLADWDSSDKTPRSSHIGYRTTLVNDFHERFGDHLSFNQKADIALAGQSYVARRLCEYLNEIRDKIDVLVLSGGIALNCTINAQIAKVCDEHNVQLIIPPFASDTGVALGAAIAVHDFPSRLEPLKDPYLGRNYSPTDIARELSGAGYQIQPMSAKEIAEKLWNEQLICGWFEGRSEMGPRALGKRCIVARPDQPKLRDKLNYIKGRESWRPLAPSVTAKEFARSYEGSFASGYMLINALGVGDSLDRLKGVIHVDGSSRPQVVEAHQAQYLELLCAVGSLSGTEALICTSFNQAGEPIVYAPMDAVRSAKKMGLDFLAGDGWYLPLKDG